MDRNELIRVLHEIDRLKRATNRLKLIIAVLGIVVAIFIISLIVVAGVHGRDLRSLDNWKKNYGKSNVSFVSNAGNKSMDGYTYGGSLFRGSGFWASKVPLPFKQLTDHAAIGVESDEAIYIIGGANVNGTILDSVWKYNPVYHNYTQKASMPAPRFRFGATLLNNMIYVVGGRTTNATDPTSVDGQPTQTTHIYDISADTWTAAADQLEVHSDSCAASLNGLIYLVGGYGADYSELSSAEVYDPKSNKWSKIIDMPTRRGDLMCASFLGEIYVLGGFHDPAGEFTGNRFSTKMESYNPNTTKWTTRPDLLTARGDGAVVVLPGNKLMLVGGEGHYSQNANYKYPKHVNEIYFGDDQTWVEKAMIPTARFRTAAAAVGGLAYVFGGADLCLDQTVCPGLNNTEVYLDVDHPHVYIFLANEAYNDNQALTTYPF